MNRVRIRFEALIDKTETCWQWKGVKCPQGYGHISYKGRPTGAHRVSYLLYRGEFPQHLQVLHTCDNTSCVNPDHLFIGTQKENMADRTEKGRTLFGERNPRAVLSKYQVRRIREFRDVGVSAYDLKMQYGVSLSTIHKVLRNETYTQGQI
jgi:hypothetical protein